MKNEFFFTGRWPPATTPHFFKTKKALFRKYFFNHLQCISCQHFTLTNTYTKTSPKIDLIFSKLLYILILLTFAKDIIKQPSRFQSTIDFSTENASPRLFLQTFFFRSIFFSYIIQPGKNVKIQIWFCELGFYKKVVFLPLPIPANSLLFFSKQSKFFFNKNMHKKEWPLQAEHENVKTI